MFRMHARWLLFFYAVIGLWPMSALAMATEEDQMGQELATILRSARKVISDNQELINDARRGEKGLSSEKVIALTQTNYQRVSGVALSLSEPGGRRAIAKQALMVAIREVMNEAQPQINAKGVGYKGFLPVIFAMRVCDKFTHAMGGKIRIRITAPQSYLRNPAHAPDEWESRVFETVFRLTNYPYGKPYSEMTTNKGKPVFRYMLPEYYGPSCLGCHGEPKGSRDISGGIKEGRKLDDLGGAISIAISE